MWTEISHLSAVLLSLVGVSAGIFRVLKIFAVAVIYLALTEESRSMFFDDVFTDANHFGAAFAAAAAGSNATNTQ